MRERAAVVAVHLRRPPPPSPSRRETRYTTRVIAHTNGRPWRVMRVAGSGGGVNDSVRAKRCRAPRLLRYICAPNRTGANFFARIYSRRFGKHTHAGACERASHVADDASVHASVLTLMGLVIIARAGRVSREKNRTLR